MSNLDVDVNSIDEGKKNLIIKLDEIINEYDYLFKMVEESQNLFDSKTAEYLREKIFDNIKEQKDYINNNFFPFINELDDIKNKYANLYNDIKKEVS